MAKRIVRLNGENTLLQHWSHSCCCHTCNTYELFIIWKIIFQRFRWAITIRTLNMLYCYSIGKTNIVWNHMQFEWRYFSRLHSEFDYQSTKWELRMWSFLWCINYYCTHCVFFLLHVKIGTFESMQFLIFFGLPWQPVIVTFVCEW